MKPSLWHIQSIPGGNYFKNVYINKQYNNMHENGSVTSPGNVSSYCFELIICLATMKSIITDSLNLLRLYVTMFTSLRPSDVYMRQ